MTNTPRADALLTALISGEPLYEGFAQLTEEHEREKALHVLLALLSDPDIRLREYATKALSVLGDQRAVEPLLFSLEADENSPDLDRTLLAARVEALIAIGDPQSILPLLLHSDVNGDWELYDKLLEFDKDDLLHILEQVVKHPDDALRELAFSLLGGIDDPRSIKLLIEALEDTVVSLRHAAVLHLGVLRATEAVPFLILCITDSDVGVRQRTAIVLGDMGDPQAIPALLLLLNDEEREIRLHAAIALGKLGDASGLDVIHSYAFDYTWYRWSHFDEVLKVLQGFDEPLVPLLLAWDQRYNLYRSVEYNTQLLIAEIFAEANDPAALPMLERMLKSRDEAVRLAVQQAIYHITGNQAKRNDE